MENQTINPVYLFHNGANYRSHMLLSPMKGVKDGKEGWTFRTYAPNALSVSVVGIFNNWDRNNNKLVRVSEGGIWETFVEGLCEYDLYKYSIEGIDGNIVFKTDPYALHSETMPGNASKLYDINNFVWNDAEWLKKRENTDTLSSPMNIYELHMGSWRRNKDGNVYSYRQLADEIVSYVSAMNYTHIELMPVTEYPYDGSWGYQVTGMFAPTSRYGSPADFQYLINKCHKKNIGVIVDWVAAHFPKDEHGLYKYDGTYLYEYKDELKREHKEWGTVVFDYDNAEVRSFLISSALFWIEQYHIDGLRVDAVASMLYLDYAREEGEWHPNHLGTNINLEAVAFIKELNKAVLSRCNGALMIAEESTTYPLITKPAYDGGLGFNYKWNMGWMNDTLVYASMDPYFRQHNHDKITFSLTYAYSENYILPFSHDEVVHGKCSMVSKMPGYYDDKFMGLKCILGYQMSFPGKKLNFMGNEIAQFIEWKYDNQLDWFLLDYDSHKLFNQYVKDLNAYYLNNREMYEQDTSTCGFEWVVVDDNQQNVVAYKRIDSSGQYTLCIMNFSPIERKDYKIGVDENGSYRVALNSNDYKYGGNQDKIRYKANKGFYHGKEYYIAIHLPPNCVQYIKKVQSGRK